MPKLLLSDGPLDRDGLQEFRDPKSGETVRTFPTATVYFVSGTVVHGSATTPAIRRSRRWKFVR